MQNGIKGPKAKKVVKLLKPMEAVAVPAILAIAMYISFQIFSDILSTKIAFLAILGLAVDGGTLIYPLTFTVRDFVHKTLGKKMARVVVLVAGGLNVLMVGLFWLIGVLPADASWSYQDAYNVILMPVARITLASIMAEVFSELIDTEVFGRLYKKFEGKYEIGAVLLSNLIALLFDSVIFGLIAFYGELPNDVVGQIILANILIKGVMTLLSAPLIKLIPRKVSFDKM